MNIEFSIAVVAISIFLLMLFSLLVMIWYGRSNKAIWLVIPLILWLSVSTYSTIGGLLGYPVLAKDIGDGNLYITHVIGGEQKWIYFWVLDTDTYIPKAYKIVYTKKLEKKIAEAKKRAGLGFPQGLKFQTGSGLEESESTLQLYDFNKLEGTIK